MKDMKWKILRKNTGFFLLFEDMWSSPVLIPSRDEYKDVQEKGFMSEMDAFYKLWREKNTLVVEFRWENAKNNAGQHAQNHSDPFTSSFLVPSMAILFFTIFSPDFLRICHKIFV
jgi:hypothetical protein